MGPNHLRLEKLHCRRAIGCLKVEKASMGRLLKRFAWDLVGKRVWHVP